MNIARRVCLISVLALLQSASALAYELWYEDNNMGKAGSVPHDFKYKFEHPESWKDTMRSMNVYMFRANIFEDSGNGITDDFIRQKMIPVLAQAKIKVAIDTGVANWSACKDRTAEIAQSKATLKRLRSLGVPFDYFSLQSVLSKPMRGAAKEIPCPLEAKVKGAIDYVKGLPDLPKDTKIGIIDALPSHGEPYKEAYKYTRDMFRAAGVRLDYIHLDGAVGSVAGGRYGMSWEKVKEISQYVRSLGLQFGVILASRRGGESSDEAYHHGVVKAVREYKEAGGTADQYIVASFYKHPVNSVYPQGARSAGEYPALGTVDEVAAVLRGEAGRAREGAKAEKGGKGGGKERGEGGGRPPALVRQLKRAVGM